MMEVCTMVEIKSVIGIRPVVTLKEGIRTSGQKEEIVGTDGTTTAMVWHLVEP